MVNKDLEIAEDPKVSSDLRTPLYHQIYLILLNKIQDKTYPPDSLIPNEVQITEMYKVSRITAIRALNELAANNYVIRERGKGTRVCSTLPEAPLELPSDDLLENLFQMDLKTDIKLLHFEYVKAAPMVARFLNCDEGQLVQTATRIRFYHQKPFSHLTTYVPESVGRTFSKGDLGTISLTQLLEKSGIRIERAEHTITAVLADSTIAPLLEMEVGSPLIKVNKTVFDQNNKPVEYLIALYRPDRYNYRINLSRGKGSNSKSWFHSEEDANK